MFLSCFDAVESRKLQSIACCEHTRAFKFPLLCSQSGRKGVAKACKDQFGLLYKLLPLLSLSASVVFLVLHPDSLELRSLFVQTPDRP